MAEWLGHPLLSPALLLMAGGLALPLLPKSLRHWFALLLPVAGLALLCALPTGRHGVTSLLGFDLVTLRVDHLSFIWAVIFHIAAFIGGLYALHVRDTMQHVAALTYAGAAIGAVLAGDLVTLFIFWELTAVTSVFLIWARRSETAYRAGLRYLAVHAISGLLIMAGVVIRYRATGSIAFNHIGIDSLSGVLIFLGFGIKCAFPFLHNWLQDAYPKATVTGTVMLSVFSTKLAIYALARGYAGTDVLITIGAVMACFPIFFAVIENDMRRVLSYSLNNQLGYMVVGIGIGTPLAIDGTAAHAFAHIIYKALLFMSMGAVLYRTGTIKASRLGGLFKSMPWTAGLCIVGSLSISAFPLFSGFVTKSMILTATAGEGHWIAWLALVVASAGVLDHSGIKIPYFSFFHHDSGIRCREAPWNMLLAMGIAAFLCIGIGVYPEPLYALLPYPVDYSAYTAEHILSQLQLLLFAALAFTVLMRRGLYPSEDPAINLDTDWLYRRLLPALARSVTRSGNNLARPTATLLQRGRVAAGQRLRQIYAGNGVMSRAWSTGAMVAWVTVVLAAYLLIYY